MTVKQAKFSQLYASNGGNGRQAAIEAGHPPRSAQQIASENLLKPVVAGAIDGYRASAIKSINIDRDRVLAGLLQEATEADRASDRISAWTALAKILGLMVDRHRVEALVSHQQVFEGLTKSDLLVLVDEGRQAKAIREGQAIEGESHAIE